MDTPGVVVRGPTPAQLARSQRASAGQPTAGGSNASSASAAPASGSVLALLGAAAREHHLGSQPRTRQEPERTGTSAGEGAAPGEGAPAASGGEAHATRAAFEARFAETASDHDAFHALMRQSFGEGYDHAAAETIRQQTLSGDFSWMPEIEVVDASVLVDESGTQTGGTALGAYSAETDTIYLSRELLAEDPGRALEILTEEVGHGLDARLNETDSAGDEGEIFARLSAGDELSAEELDALRSENDSGTITVDGKTIEIEYGCNPIKAIGNAFKAVGNAIGGAFEFVYENVVQPVVQGVAEVATRVYDTVVGLARDLLPILVDVLRFPLDLARTVLEGGGRVLEALLRGDFRGALRALLETGGKLLLAPVRQVVDTLLMGAHAAVNAIDNLRGAVTERGLTAEEIAYLRPIYGDSIDYGAVRVQSGGLKQAVGFRANVVGNDVFLPESSFEADGTTLTAAGLETLGHEIAHVWQYQNRGADYLSGAIFAQVTEGATGVGTGGAYDWVAAAGRGERFDDMNPESQAELASYIGQSIGPDGEVDRAALQRLIRTESGDASFVVDDALFAVVVEAHDILRGIG